MKPIVLKGGSSKIFSDFVKIYEDIKPIKKILCFFDNENFLLSKYTPTNLGTNMIIESYSGQEIHVESNCGYGGEGPRSTNRLLLHIGIPSNLAEDIFFYDAFKADFNEDGKVKDFRVFTPFFRSNIRKSPTNLYTFDEYSKVYLMERRIIMVNPQRNNFKGLINCLDVMKPREFEYYIGKESPILNGFMDTKSRLKVSIVIYGEAFDVYCLVSSSDVLALINVLYTYLFGYPLFNEVRFGDDYIFSKNKNIGYIKPKKKKNQFKSRYFQKSYIK